MGAICQLWFRIKDIYCNVQAVCYAQKTIKTHRQQMQIDLWIFTVHHADTPGRRSVRQAETEGERECEREGGMDKWLLIRSGDKRELFIADLSLI